jgi:hypothetical protein
MKGDVVGVFAMDEEGGRHVVEIQGWNAVALLPRILLGLTGSCEEQAWEGMAMKEKLLVGAKRPVHRFTFWDREEDWQFSRDPSKHLIELQRCKATGPPMEHPKGGQARAEHERPEKLHRGGGPSVRRRASRGWRLSSGASAGARIRPRDERRGQTQGIPSFAVDIPRQHLKSDPHRLRRSGPAK